MFMSNIVKNYYRVFRSLSVEFMSIDSKNFFLSKTNVPILLMLCLNIINWDNVAQRLNGAEKLMK